MPDTGRQPPPLDVLLVEDNPADVDLIRGALDAIRTPPRVSVVTDGVRADDFLRRRGEYTQAPRPHLILLDLNLPRRSGLEVLALIKSAPELRAIPVIVLTSSDADHDIARSYAGGANGFITKPMDLAGMKSIVSAVEAFWFTAARLPGGEAIPVR
jgi:CheY-like chemotaxis protein